MKDEDKRAEREHQIIYYSSLISPLPLCAQSPCYGQKDRVHFATFLEGGEKRCLLQDGWQQACGEQLAHTGEGGSCSGGGGCRGRWGWVVRQRVLYLVFCRLEKVPLEHIQLGGCTQCWIQVAAKVGFAWLLLSPRVTTNSSLLPRFVDIWSSCFIYWARSALCITRTSTKEDTIVWSQITFTRGKSELHSN